MATSPPRLAEALLRLLLPREDAEVIAGDLEETLHTAVAPGTSARAARFWYWRQAFSILARRALERRTDSTGSPQKRIAMAAVRQDLSYAVRSLRKQPGFTATAILMLALGIGATVAIFALSHAVLFKPLPFADPDRLMLVQLLAPARDSGTLRPMIWSYPKYRVLSDNQRVFDSTSAFSPWSWNLTGSGSPERINGEVVESSYFQVLGLSPHGGRTFSAEETGAPGSAPLAVLGHGFWMRRFGSESSVIGQTVGLSGVAHTVIGVLPPGFRGLTGEADVFVPITTFSAADLGEAWNHSYWVVARRKVEATPGAVEAEVKSFGSRINEMYPDPVEKRGGWTATAVPLDDERAAPIIRRSILLLLAAVASVLVIVCVNLANLMLVRGLARQREVAIRLALGASRLRIVRQFMTESLLLAGCGAAVGLAVAYGAVSAGAALMPDLRMVLPRGETGFLTRVGLGALGFDGTLLVFVVVMAVTAAGLFGLGPAWRASRRDLSSTMKAGASGSVSQGTHVFAPRNLLIVGEMALALVLLTAGGLMLKSVAKLQATELGFRPDALLTLRIALPGPQYRAQSATEFLERLLERLGARVDISVAAYGSCAPVSGGCNRTSIGFPDRAPAPRGSEPMIGVMWASPRYFETIGTRLVRGRIFTDFDRAGQPKVVVINETAARAFWKDEEPIGRRVSVGQGGFGDGAEVVGIVADVRYGAVETSVMPDVYLPLLQSPRASGVIFVRSQTPPESLVPALRAEVQALDPNLPLTDIKMMEERFGDATWRPRIMAWLIGAFAALALLLAALGIYGLMSQGVEQRRREIGVRMALGAARGDILRLVIGRVLAIAVGGILLGIALAVPSMRLLTALLYEVRPGDPLVLATLALVLLLVAVLAGYLPARRATRVDPLTSLRME